MGKQVLTVGAFSCFDGSNFFSYGITSQNLSKTVAEADLTDTFSPPKDKEWRTGRKEIVADVTIWKNVNDADLLLATVYEDGILDFEGYVYHGEFLFLETNPSAQVDEGIGQSYQMRFSGSVSESKDNLIVGGGGYDTTAWDDIATDFTVGGDGTLTLVQANGFDYCELKKTGAGAAVSLQQNIVFPACTGYLLLIDVFRVDNGMVIDLNGSGRQFSFDPTTTRKIYYLEIPYDAGDNDIEIAMDPSGANINDVIQINRLNLLEIPS